MNTSVYSKVHTVVYMSMFMTRDKVCVRVLLNIHSPAQTEYLMFCHLLIRLAVNPMAAFTRQTLHTHTHARAHTYLKGKYPQAANKITH